MTDIQQYYTPGPGGLKAYLPPPVMAPGTPDALARAMTTPIIYKGQWFTGQKAENETQNGKLANVGAHYIQGDFRSQFRGRYLKQQVLWAKAIDLNSGTRVEAEIVFYPTRQYAEYLIQKNGGHTMLSYEAWARQGA